MKRLRKELPFILALTIGLIAAGFAIYHIYLIVAYWLDYFGLIALFEDGSWTTYIGPVKVIGCLPDNLCSPAYLKFYLTTLA